MQRRQVETGIYWVLGLLVVYVLSAGPVIDLAFKGVVPMTIIHVYEPLRFVIHMPVLGDALTSYLGWWCRGDIQVP